MRVVVQLTLDRGMPGKVLRVLQVVATSEQDRKAGVPEQPAFP